jgi:hypothetical protein
MVSAIATVMAGAVNFLEQSFSEQSESDTCFAILVQTGEHV